MSCTWTYQPVEVGMHHGQHGRVGMRIASYAPLHRDQSPTTILPRSWFIKTLIGKLRGRRIAYFDHCNNKCSFLISIRSIAYNMLGKR